MATIPFYYYYDYTLRLLSLQPLCPSAISLSTLSLSPVHLSATSPSTFPYLFSHYCFIHFSSGHQPSSFTETKTQATSFYPLSLHLLFLLFSRSFSSVHEQSPFFLLTLLSTPAIFLGNGFAFWK